MTDVRRFLRAATLVLLLAPLGAQQPPALTSLPDDLQALVQQLSEQSRTNPVQGRQAISQAGRLVPKTAVTGENRVYGALLAIRGHQYRPALDLALQYLEGHSKQRELALAVAIESASWLDTEFARARELYRAFTREFGGSVMLDPFRAGAPLRLTVEEAMARLAYLDGEDRERAAMHYQQALKALDAGDRRRVPPDDLFRLRWYYADAIAGLGRGEEALQFLYETRPIVKGHLLLELQLEDFILFKETDQLLNQGRYAEARAILEKRLPEFSPAPVNKRRIGKLLDRVKLVGAPAPELAPNIRWVGGRPHGMTSLRGHVVMLEFFTSG